MKRLLLTILLMVCSASALANNEEYNCAYLDGSKIQKLILYNNNSGMYFTLNGHKYLLDEFDQVGAIYTGFTKPYTSQNGRILQMGIGYENNALYVLAMNAKTKDYVFVEQLNCVIVK